MLFRHTRRAIHSKKSPLHNPYRRQLEAMEKKLDKTYNKLNKHLKKNASFEIIEKDNRELLLLLGECNFIARECQRFKTEKNTRKKK